MSRWGTSIVKRMRRRPWLFLLGCSLLLVVVSIIGLNLWAWDHFQLAERAIRRGEAEEASEHIARTLRVWSRGPQTHLLAARIERRRGHYAEAEQHLLACLRFQGGANDASQLETLLLRAQTGDLSEVENGLWMNVEARHPKSTQILETLAGVYIRETRLENALRCLNFWLEREPQNATALHWRGWVYEAISAPEKAISDYIRALELEPERWGVRLRLVRLLLERHDMQEVEPHLEILNRTHPDDPEVQLLSAQLYQKEGEGGKAIGILDRLLAAHPNDAEAMFLRGHILQHDDPVAAEPWFRRVVEQDPAELDTGTRLQAFYALYLCLSQQGKEDKAAEIIVRYEKLKADASRLAELRDKELDRSDHHPDVMSQIGALYLRLGQDKKGLEWLYKAITKDPNHKPTHETLVKYYDSRGQTKEAAQHRDRLAHVGSMAAQSPKKLD